MTLRRILLSFVIIIPVLLHAQTNGIVSGPMLGPVELRDAKIWLEVTPAIKQLKFTIKRRASIKKCLLSTRVP
jgi:hypothetical protein